tara:strand:+ start:675 stop:1526 length:852 start_codon:yes stop_codon:yes gene_type:complete
MEIHELLDRFELIYQKDFISNLRRSYIDKDLYSIFKLLDEKGYDQDLKKLILFNDYHALWRLLERETNSALIPAIKKHYNILGDALSQGQIKSKQWLLSKIKGLDLGTVFICAGWYGILATMMFEDENVYVDKIRSFDIDDSCYEIAEDFNKPWAQGNWKFKASTLDIHSFNWSDAPAPSDGTIGNFYYDTIAQNKTIQMRDNPDTFINTSCEHIEQFTKWFTTIPKNKLVVLQTNNYFKLLEHVNCVKDINQFKLQAPLSNIIYEGELVLEKYTRFMLIGYV